MFYIQLFQIFFQTVNFRAIELYISISSIIVNYFVNIVGFSVRIAGFFVCLLMFLHFPPSNSFIYSLQDPVKQQKIVMVSRNQTSEENADWFTVARPKHANVFIKYMSIVINVYMSTCCSSIHALNIFLKVFECCSDKLPFSYNRYSTVVYTIIICH